MGMAARVVIDCAADDLRFLNPLANESTSQVNMIQNSLGIGHVETIAHDTSMATRFRGEAMQSAVVKATRFGRPEAVRSPSSTPRLHVANVPPVAALNQKLR